MLRDAVIMERSGFAGQIKLFFFIKKENGLSRPEFLGRWRDVRESRLMQTQAFRNFVGRLVQNEIDAESDESVPGSREFDLVLELWFDSVREVAQFAASTDVIDAITGTGADYSDRDQTLIYLGQERPESAQWLRRSQNTNPGRD